MMKIPKPKNIDLSWSFTKYVLITNRAYPQIYEVKPEYEETFKDNLEQTLIMLINDDNDLICYLQEVKLPGLVLGKVYPFELPKHIGERND